jgi:hypothetical protein
MPLTKLVVACIILFLSKLLCADNLNYRVNMGNYVSDNEQDLKLEEWRVTNDAVMGGLSVGTAQLDHNTFIFSGNVSTENNGGFTSAFKKIPTLPAHVKLITIRIMGDGNNYQLRVRSQVTGYDLAYKIGFNTTKGKIEEHTLKLADFKASFRGRIIESAPLLEARFISHVGFLITAKKSQYFTLSVHNIEFF